MPTPPIVVCTVTERSLPVLEASVLAYSPETWLHVNVVPRTTFGQSYNAAMREAFKTHDEVIIANDDVVLTPATMPLLLEDVATLKAKYGDKLGFVAATADDVRWYQKGPIASVTLAERISPLFAWVSKTAFGAAQFPPLNWYSDDVMCEDLNRLGFQHAISRAYVHHVGSQTIGLGPERLTAEAAPWLREHRPDYYKKWFSWENAPQ